MACSFPTAPARPELVLAASSIERMSLFFQGFFFPQYLLLPRLGVMHRVESLHR